MSHAGAAESLDESFLDDAVLDVERELAGALLGSAPADAVGEPAYILYLLDLDPLALFGYGVRAVLRAFGDGAHVFYFA